MTYILVLKKGIHSILFNSLSSEENPESFLPVVGFKRYMRILAITTRNRRVNANPRHFHELLIFNLKFILTNKILRTGRDYARKYRHLPLQIYFVSNIKQALLYRKSNKHFNALQLWHV